jgi:hypothetical protein
MYEFHTGVRLFGQLFLKFLASPEKENSVFKCCEIYFIWSDEGNDPKTC